MISKIHKIQGVGRFKNCKPSSPIVLDKLNLIFGENGWGKSTFADILRSLGTGQDKRLTGRKTIGTEHQSIVLELDNETRLAFSSENQKWHQDFDDILVFDQEFVNENIYAGSYIDTSHKRKLVELIIGDVAVSEITREKELKNSIELKKQIIRDLTDEIKDKIYQPENDPAGKISVDDFVSLNEISDIDQKLEEQIQRVEQLKDVDRLRAASTFASINLPVFPLDKLENLLKTTLEHVEMNAEQQLQVHLSKFSNGQMEDWIERGTIIGNEATDTCPYCGQSLSNSHLIKHYQTYFSQEYKQLKSRILRFNSTHLNFDKQLDDINKAITTNESVSALWAEKLKLLELPPMNFDKLKLGLVGVNDEIKALLSKKREAPLESYDISEGLMQKLKAWEDIQRIVAEYNYSLKKNNETVAKLKAETASGSLVEQESIKLNLRNIKNRFLPEVANLCDEYRNETAALKAEEDQKKLVRKKIDETIVQTFHDYKDCLNKHLENFGTNFKIGDLDQKRDQKSMRLEFNIALAEEKISLGNQKSEVASRSFRNVLSDGDKRTLALSFFLSKLEFIPDVSNKIIVFDDPVTSMDDNRLRHTFEVICDLCEDVKQVIILSHRPNLLYTFWDEYGNRGSRSDTTKLLQICPQRGTPEYSEIRENWDIESSINSPREKHFRNVLDFVNGDSDKDPIEIARCLRPLLESRYRYLYPDQYSSRIKNLGGFINCIENSSANSPLHSLKGSLRELQSINSFAVKFHHDKNKLPPTTTVSELTRYCNRVLKLLGRR